MAARRKKSHGQGVSVAECIACIFSGNRRTPRRIGLTTTTGGADTDFEYQISVNHQVRLLSVEFRTGEVYHEVGKSVKEIEVQSCP
jgi:hypothetical protein